jgi:hypothetical protein
MTDTNQNLGDAPNMDPLPRDADPIWYTMLKLGQLVVSYGTDACVERIAARLLNLENRTIYLARRDTEVDLLVQEVKSEGRLQDKDIEFPFFLYPRCTKPKSRARLRTLEGNPALQFDYLVEKFGSYLKKVNWLYIRGRQNTPSLRMILNGHHATNRAAGGPPVDPRPHPIAASNRSSIDARQQVEDYAAQNGQDMPEVVVRAVLAAMGGRNAISRHPRPDHVQVIAPQIEQVDSNSAITSSGPDSGNSNSTPGRVSGPQRDE